MLEVFVSAAIAYALVATRMASFVAVSPFPGPTVPGQVKIGLVLLLALAAAPALAGVKTPAIGLGLLTAGFGEVATGAAIGLIFRIATSSADVLGGSLAHAMGLTLASTYDPTQGTSTDPLTRLVTTLGGLVAIAIGAHRVVISAVIASVHAVPLGEVPALDAFSQTALLWASRSFDCGLGLALPAITVSLSVQIALALVARAAPALQVFSVGLSLTLASGLLVILSGTGDLTGGLAAHFAELGQVIERSIAR